MLRYFRSWHVVCRRKVDALRGAPRDFSRRAPILSNLPTSFIEHGGSRSKQMAECRVPLSTICSLDRCMSNSSMCSAIEASTEETASACERRLLACTWRTAIIEARADLVACKQDPVTRAPDQAQQTTSNNAISTRPSRKRQIENESGHDGKTSA